jgi:transcriptional regulator with XRE-family HTH domain
MTAKQVTAEEAFRQEVGRRIAAARKAAELSIVDIAGHLGVNRATVGHWETGKNPVDIGKLYRLARMLGVEPAALLSDASPPEPIAEAAPEEPAAIEPWPFKILSRSQWQGLDDTARGAAELAALQVAERWGPAVLSRKRAHTA